MNKNLSVKRKLLLFFLASIIVLGISILVIMLFRKSDNLDIESYDPNNSYIISSEQIKSKVKNETEARELLARFELGDEYILKGTFDLNGGIVYHFQESYKGIPVHGRYSNVITSADMTAEGISSNFYPVHVDISPKIDSDNVLDICRYYLNQTNIEKDNVFVELCIYGYDVAAKLSYCAYIGSNSVYIDARTGDIIQVFNNIQTLNCLLTGNLGEVEVTVQENNGGYELLDTSRGGGIESCIVPAEAEGVFDFENKDRTRVIISSNDMNENYSAVDAYYNVELTYDYYSEMHHFYSTDGNDSREIHIINDVAAYKNFNNNSEVEYFQNNAAATTLFDSDGEAETWFIISKVNDNAEFLYSYYLDVIAHEYTHAVMFSIIGNSQNSQMNAMSEAYSDIMGECCEAFYKMESDWNLPGCRNISDIANGEGEETNINHIDQYSDNLDGHDASTIISSAAYYMFMGVNEYGESDSQYAIHSYEALSKLWFTSMFYLTPSSDFLTCRYAVESAADLMIKENVINEVQAQGIRNAFDKVGIEGNIIMKTADLLSVSPDFMLQIKDKEDRDYTECDITISCIYKGHDYYDHNMGIQYRSKYDESIYDGSFEEYPQKKIKYKEGAVYLIVVRDSNSLFEEAFQFEIKDDGSEELILHTSFLGTDFNPFETESSDSTAIQEDKDTPGGFVLQNPYPEGYQMNETSFDNLFSGHFANMSAPMGLEPGCTYEPDKKFALKASYDMEDPVNGAHYLLIADVLGNVYDMLPISQYPREATGWLKNDVFYCSDKGTADIMKQGEIITDNFFESDISLMDVVNDSNGIMFFTAKTVFDSPYRSDDSSTDTKYEIWSDSGKVIISFYKNELVNKYGIDSWLSNGLFHLVHLGNGIYHISDRYEGSGIGSAQYIFIDVNRKKAFAIPVKDNTEYEDIESDGNYILIPHYRSNSATVFDIETESCIYIENVSEAYGLGEGKFFTDTCCYSVQGNIIFEDQDINLEDEIVSKEAYHDGQALVIIDEGQYYQSSDHKYGIGFIDESGTDVNIIASLQKSSHPSCSFINELNAYCIFTREGVGGFLSNSILQEQSLYGASNEDCYYGVINNGNKAILRYGYIDNDYSDEIRAEPMFGYELFTIS